MIRSYVGRAVEKLIEEADFFPIAKDEQTPFSLDEKNILLRKGIGKKVKFIEIYNCDLLKDEEITSDIFSSNQRNKENVPENLDVFYTKVLIFSQTPSVSLIKNISNAYQDRIKSKNDMAYIAISLMEKVFASEGIVYPNHIIYECFEKAFEEADENYEFDLNRIFEKKEERKPKLVVDKEEKSIFNTFCLWAALVYMVVFMLISSINMWAKAFSGGSSDGVIYSSSVSFILNMIFILTVGLLVEYNFGGKKIFTIVLIGGILNIILIRMFFVYILIVPIIGALFYMRYRVKDIFSKSKYLYYIFLVYIAYVVLYSINIAGDFMLLPITGIIPGFCIAGILGFEGDTTDSDLKKKLFVILSVYVLGVAAFAVLSSMLFF